MPKFELVDRPHPVLENTTQRLYRLESGTVMSAISKDDSDRWEAAVLDADGQWLTRTIFPRADKLEQDVLFGMSEAGLLAMLEMIESWEDKHK